MRKPIIVNLFGGPSSGKSTTAAGIFHKLKMQGINCEIVTEFAKHMTWKEDFNTLKNQVYVHAKQHDRMFHLVDKVDVIITDSPTIMGLIYCDWNVFPKSFETLVVDLFNSQGDNLNYLLRRSTTYQTVGRSQTEEEAKEKDLQIVDLISKHDLECYMVAGDESAVDRILEQINERLEKRNKHL
jgi:hypothetical protein